MLGVVNVYQVNITKLWVSIWPQARKMGMMNLLAPSPSERSIDGTTRKIPEVKERPQTGSEGNEPQAQQWQSWTVIFRQLKVTKKGVSYNHRVKFIRNILVACFFEIASGLCFPPGIWRFSSQRVPGWFLWNPQLVSRGRTPCRQECEPKSKGHTAEGRAWFWTQL